MYIHTYIHTYDHRYGGSRCLVINSSLMINGSGAPLEAATQDLWFEEEIEQAKMCSTHMMIFSYHPWFVGCRDEEDEGEGEGGGGGKAHPKIVPEPIRTKWLKILRHKKVKYLFAGTMEIAQNSSAWTFKDECNERSNEKRSKMREKRMAYEAAERICELNNDGDPLKPSEIIAQGSGNKPITFDDVAIEVEGDIDSDNIDKPTVHEEEKVVLDYPPLQGELNEDENEDEDEDDNNSEGSVESEYLNQDEDYPGPEMIVTAPMTTYGNDGIQIIRVYEDSTTLEFVNLDNCPKSVEI